MDFINSRLTKMTSGVLLIRIIFKLHEAFTQKLQYQSHCNPSQIQQHKSSNNFKFLLEPTSMYSSNIISQSTLFILRSVAKYTSNNKVRNLQPILYYHFL